MNQLFLTGTLGREPELKQSTSGQKYLRNSIAVWRPSTNKDDAVDFLPFVAFDKTAEFIKRYVKKDSRINITGWLKMSKYKDKVGTERTSYEVVVDKVEFGVKGKAVEA